MPPSSQLANAAGLKLLTDVLTEAERAVQLAVGKPIASKYEAPRVRVLFGLFRKGVQTTRAANELTKLGYTNEAHALLRPLLETALDMLELVRPIRAASRRKLVNRYIAYCELQNELIKDPFKRRTAKRQAEIQKRGPKRERSLEPTRWKSLEPLKAGCPNAERRVTC